MRSAFACILIFALGAARADKCADTEFDDIHYDGWDIALFAVGTCCWVGAIVLIILTTSGKFSKAESPTQTRSALRDSMSKEELLSMTQDG